MHRFIRHFHMQRIFIRIRINRYRLDAHLLRRLDHATSNFTTIGDEDFFKHQNL